MVVHNVLNSLYNLHNFQWEMTTLVKLQRDNMHRNSSYIFKTISNRCTCISKCLIKYQNKTVSTASQ